MKRLFFAVMLALAFATANAQTPTFTVPQSVTPTHVFTGVSTAQASGCLSNQGQNVHFVFYESTGATANPSGVEIRIEGSFNSDSATCSTGTWFAISDEGTDPGASGVNLILAVQSYPYLRLNLVKCSGCNGNNTIDAFYTASSSMPGNPFGTYGAGQQVRKVSFVAQSTDANAISSPIQTPYGSTAGFLVLNSNGAFAATSSLLVRDKDFGLSNTVTTFTLPTTGALNIAIPISGQPATTVDVRYTQVSSVQGKTFNAWYVFLPPGGVMPAGAQPSAPNNTEATAAANTAVVTTLTVGAFQRAHLFNVNARCSAGTAQLTVADGSTQVWSSAATEVGTTSFTKFWNPGLAGSPNNNLVITLGTCGVSNTGTLDVQGSVF